MIRPSQTEERIKLRVKQQYDYLSDDDVQSMYLMAISDYVMIRYPSENNRPKIEDVVIDFFVEQWIYKRIIDILSRAGGLNVIAYKENDLSIQYASGNIDPELVKQIMPKASVPR